MALFQVFCSCNNGHVIGCEIAQTMDEALILSKKYKKGKLLDGYVIDHVSIEEI